MPASLEGRRAGRQPDHLLVGGWAGASRARPREGSGAGGGPWLTMRVSKGWQVGLPDECRGCGQTRISDKPRVLIVSLVQARPKYFMGHAGKACFIVLTLLNFKGTVFFMNWRFMAALHRASQLVLVF